MEKIEKQAKLPMKRDLRPKRSAIRANRSRNEPPANLEHISAWGYQFGVSLQTYDEAADIHVISGVDMWRS